VPQVLAHPESTLVRGQRYAVGLGQSVEQESLGPVGIDLDDPPGRIPGAALIVVVVHRSVGGEDEVVWNDRGALELVDERPIAAAIGFGDTDASGARAPSGEVGEEEATVAVDHEG